MKSRISRGENRGPRNTRALSEVVLRGDSKSTETAGESDDPEEIVARAESRAREDREKSGSKRSSKFIAGKRQDAEALHRQADILHHRGDYEAALVLYHRASRANPREAKHAVAVSRTTAAITSATSSTGLSKEILPRTKNAAQLAANHCPETAALRARKAVEESTEPILAISQILEYFDSRKDFWRDPSIAHRRRDSKFQSKSRKMLQRLSNMANEALRKLRASRASGDSRKCLKIGDELLIVSSALPDRFRYQVAARHYMALSQISLGRHDRAIVHASSMVRLAKVSGDASLRSKSMMTLGRVHLSFNHLDAAARAWEKLVLDVEDAVPKAWLLHEIGRCYFEMKRYARAREMARRCLEYADEGNSRKWRLHGELLTGQSLVELGRLGEAVRALEAAARAASEEKDTSTVEYVSDLIDRVTGLLGRAVGPDQLLQKDTSTKNHICGAANLEDDEYPGVETENIFERTDSPPPTIWRRAEERKNSSRDASSRINESKLLMKKIESTGRTMTEKLLSGQRKIPKSSVATESIERDIDESETSITKISSFGSFQEEARFSSPQRGDVSGSEDVSLNSRIRVIHTTISSDENSPSKLGENCGNVVTNDQEQNSSRCSENSDNSGNTYVLDESRKDSITDERPVSTVSDTKLAECQPENLNFDKSEFIDELDNSSSNEYSNDDRADDPRILRPRICPYDEGIDEEEDEAADDENNYENIPNALLNHREVVSPCESQVSPASTAKTYLVNERRTMSYSAYETADRRYKRKCNSSSNISPSRDSPRKIDSRITSATIKTIGDTPWDSIVEAERQKTTEATTNRTIEQSRAEWIRARRYNNGDESPTRSGLYDEGSSNCTRGISTVLVEHLATGESILDSPSYGFACSALGPNPLYRHSLPSSATREKPPQSP